MPRLLLLALAATLAAAPAAIAQPVNDDCISALPVAIGTPVAGSTAGASGSDVTTCTTGDAPDAWYRVTAPESGVLTAQTCGSDFDTSLALFDGCGGAELACNDDDCGLHSVVTAGVSAGQGVVIRVSGYQGATGDFTLLVEFTAVGGPGNDACGGATAIGDGMFGGSTVGATNDGTGTCGASETSPDVWYRYTAPVTGFMTASTCGSTYDTVLGLWDECPSLGGSEVACNDDSCGLQSLVSMLVTEGQEVLIRVSGYNGAAGSYVLDVDTNEGGGGGEGPDVIYTDIQGITNWGVVDGIRAYSLGTVTCNIGDMDLQWGGTTPLLAMNAYRLYDGRLIQIGMSWVKNGTSAAAGDGCGLPCNGNGGNVLGVGCRDTYSSGFNGGFGVLGPRSAVNPFTGAYPGPSGGGGDVIYKRLQIAEGDLDQAGDGALYFVEGQYVAPDDAFAGNAMNNASYKRVVVSGAEDDLIVAGPMFPGEPAVAAWRDHGLGVDMPDPSVQVFEVDVPGEGRFHVVSKVADLGGGTWRYEYGVRNFNSHRAGASFHVPVPPCASAAGAGFHDVPYHSGEPYDGTDWAAVIDAAGVTWTCPESFAENPDANALRWATMYNFWFDSTAAPGTVTATLGLFRPGDPGSVTVDLPGPLICPADVNGDGVIDVNDLVAVVTAWGPCPPGPCPEDVDGNGEVNVDDLVAVITGWS